MAEKEYIEREAAKKVLADDYAYNAAKLLDEVPKADVQEVRHGKNVTPFHPADEFICSECGIVFKEMSEYIIEDDVYREFYFKFCPNCGAKMNKE